MRTGVRVRTLVTAGLITAALTRSAVAADVRDQTVLDNVVKDLGITLLAKPEDTFLRLPLAPNRWSLFGRVQPYASLSPRVIMPTDEPVGLPAPIRETDELAKGVGVGAGLSWHLSDHLELFGEYQLLNMGGRSGAGSPGRRELDNPGLKGGFSIRF